MASPSVVPTRRPATKKFDQSKNSTRPEKFDPSKTADQPKRNEHLDAKLELFLKRDAQFQANTVQNTIECALNIKAAHDLFRKDRANFHYWVTFAERSYHASDISYYVAIASNKHLTKKANWKFLPAGYSVLYKLAILTMNDTDAEFKAWLKKADEPEKVDEQKIYPKWGARSRTHCGKIHPNITRTQADDLLAKKRGRPTAAEKHATKKRNAVTVEKMQYELNEMKHAARQERDLRNNHFGEYRIVQEATLLLDYFRSLKQQQVDGQITQEDRIAKTRKVLIGSPVAMYATKTPERNRDFILEELRDTIIKIECVDYNSLGTWKGRLSVAEIDAAQVEIQKFALAENRKYRYRCSNEIEIHSSGLMEDWAERNLSQDLQRFLQDNDLHGVQVEITITKKPELGTKRKPAESATTQIELAATAAS